MDWIKKSVNACFLLLKTYNKDVKVWFLHHQPYPNNHHQKEVFQ